MLTLTDADRDAIEDILRRNAFDHVDSIAPKIAMRFLREGIERSAKVCDARYHSPGTEYSHDAIADCAAAIRALLE